ncbi:MAG TPA: dihydrofolate reductase family protein [Methanomassiliicoccales archaeon]|jgi:2,5-diamino-6-(ribosylamino)-4(3H)-pyrimidinone 5'-phosphate reductase
MPEVVVYNAVSADGRMDHCSFDIGTYYSIAAKMNTEVILVGSETIVSAGLTDTDADAYVPKNDPKDKRLTVAIVDGKGRIRCWNNLRNQPYWKEAVALVSASTPKEYLEYLKERKVRYASFGDDRVDLTVALEWLGTEFGAKRIRVDSGGNLNGALLRQKLVSEVHLLIHPLAVGGSTNRSMFIAPDLGDEDKAIEMDLLGTKKYEGGLLYLRYKVRNNSEKPDQ